MPKKTSPAPARVLHRYRVSIEREIRLHATFDDVEAYSQEEAKDTVLNIVDNENGHWIEGDVLSQNVRIKEVGS